jgi:hypothetical protein
LFPLFATDVVDTSGKFTICFVDTRGKFATCINYTSGTSVKIYRGVVDTGGKFATLLPVSLTRVVDNGGKFFVGVVDTSGVP